jgi:protein phosphatase
VLVVPGHALIVLIGAAGSGKSTFAARHFRATEVLSSDAFRAIVADDEADQRATPAAFDLLHRAAAHRLARARLTVVDATNLTISDRRGLLALARERDRPAVAIVLALPEAMAHARNLGRGGRVVDPAVVTRGAALASALAARPERLLGEGFRAVHVLRDVATIDRLRIAREGRPPARPSRAVTTQTSEARPRGPRARTS